MQTSKTRWVPLVASLAFLLSISIAVLVLANRFEFGEITFDSGITFEWVKTLCLIIPPAIAVYLVRRFSR
jgi:hypothetical protein